MKFISYLYTFYMMVCLVVHLFYNPSIVGWTRLSERHVMTLDWLFTLP